MPHAIDRAFERLAYALLAAGAVACCAIFALIVVSVLMRYMLSTPLRITEELSGLLLAQVVFLALPWTLVANTNIRVTLLSDRLGRLGARIAWFLGQLVLGGFLAVFLWKGWAITEFTVKLGLKSEVGRVPLAPWMVAMCVSLVLCLLIAAWQTLRPPTAKPAIL